MTQNKSDFEGFAVSNYDDSLLIEKESGFIFDSRKCLPCLPLKIFGEIYTVGCDISTKFAVDSNNKILMYDSYYGRFVTVTLDTLSKEIRDGRCSLKINDILDVLGLPHEIPEWVSIARKNGWTPPNGWDDSKTTC